MPPAKYDAIKQKFIKQGMSEKDAETHAAKIYNATRKRGQTPVGPNYDKRHKK